MKKEKGEEEDEKTLTNDPTSTLGPTRNPTDPEVTTEPIDHNRCQRPLQRARERREARLKKESDAHAELDPDPHVGPQRSSLSSAQEQDRVHSQSSSECLPHVPAVERWEHRCDRCNNKLTDSDWSRFRSEGWDVETVRHLREVQRPLRLRCSPCIDSVARALARSNRPHEFR